MKEFAEKISNAILGKTHIFSLGQAGFIMKNKRGELLAIDLYLSDCVERIEPDHIGYKRLLPKILSPDEIKLDILVCSHFHRDHYDVDAVPILMDNTKTVLFCPKDCEQDITNVGIKKYQIIEPGITVKQGDFTIHFTNCDHGDGAPYAVGIIVETDGMVILSVGDSSLRIDRKEEYLSYGDIDVLIAPINGKYGNMNENEFLKLADILNPRVSIPCHYGMFADHGGSIMTFYEKAKETDHGFLIMAQGEDYIIN